VGVFLFDFFNLIDPHTPLKDGGGGACGKPAYIVEEFFKIYPRFLSCNLESDLGLSDEGY
jgi:hypothetical protein